jgi:uncharacterized RDD family membrane protein YckC
LQKFTTSLAAESAHTILPPINAFLELMPYAYSILMHGRYGRTLGKRIMGLKVIDAGEKKEITYRQALLRDSVPLAGMFGVLLFPLVSPGTDRLAFDAWSESISLGWFLTELVTAALNDKRRALHDHIAGTVVVKV